MKTESSTSVGKRARQKSVLYSERVIERIKTQLGRDCQFEVDGKVYSPEEITSFILRKLVNDAKKVLEEKIANVVVTVPAYFGPSEKIAMAAAVEFAGLKNVLFINESKAAVYDYIMRNKENTQDRTVMVYDLGGATFDVTLIRREKMEIIKNEIMRSGRHEEVSNPKGILNKTYGLKVYDRQDPTKEPTIWNILMKNTPLKEATNDYWLTYEYNENQKSIIMDFIETETLETEIKFEERFRTIKLKIDFDEDIDLPKNSPMQMTVSTTNETLTVEIEFMDALLETRKYVKTVSIL